MLPPPPSARHQCAPAALPPPGYEARWTNLDTGEVDAGRTYVIENPEYEAFQRHGGTPYQIEPQHNDGPISPGDRLDRAIQDVDRAMGLIEKADRVLVEPATADRCLFRHHMHGPRRTHGDADLTTLARVIIEPDEMPNFHHNRRIRAKRPTNQTIHTLGPVHGGFLAGTPTAHVGYGLIVPPD